MFQIKWLWKNLQECRVQYILALCSTVILATAIPMQNTMIANIIDQVFEPLRDNPTVTAETTNLLWSLVKGLILFTLVRTTIGYISILTYESCSQKFVYSVRKHIYSNLQTQDMKFYSKNRTGDLMTRLTGDMDMVRHCIAWVFRMLIDAGVLFITTTISFYMRDAFMATCLLIVTPFIFIITLTFSKKVRPLYVELREKLSVMNTTAQENISGNKVVKAFAREEYELEKFDKCNQEYKVANTTATTLWLKYIPVIDILSQSLAVAVLLVGSVFLIDGRISIGTFTFFNGLAFSLTQPMKTIGIVLNDLQRFFASSTKIIELYYTKSIIATREDAYSSTERLKGDIEFENVTLNLNNTEILSDISLSIKAGETVAIMGPTGCGKTSLINLIPRLFDPTSGKVFIDGHDVHLFNLQNLRKSIGVANQDVFLFSETVDGNIAYSNSDLSEEAVARYAKDASVDFIEKLSDGFETIIGERGTGLSGGQKQRIALARALASQPSILILDDTTSAVDLETEMHIQHSLMNLDYECTKIIIAQRISTTKKADTIIIMDKGKIVQMGKHEDLIQIEGYYRDIFLLQTGNDDSA